MATRHQLGLGPTALTFSSSRRFSRHWRSYGLSHVASDGLLVITKATMQPRITPGDASTINSHCQPRSPASPAIPSSGTDNSELTTVETGAATRKIATARPRKMLGNQ